MSLTKVDALIQSWKDEIITKLQSWVSINSLQAERSADNAPFGTEVRRMLDLFLKDAADLGFDVDDVDGYAGSAQMGSGDQTMGILAHLDIVPAGDGWTQDPFGGNIVDGKVYGRGTQDDKGPALAALYAMRAVREAGIELKDGVRLIVGCDEETGMSDMRHYAKVRKMPNYGFSPDAEYPLINIEKGGLGLKLSSVTGGEADAEIPVYELNAGIRPNVVPGTAYAQVGTERIGLDALTEKINAFTKTDERFAVTVTDLGNMRAKISTVGIQCHAAMPELGLNAAGMLLMALDTIGAGGGSKKAIHALANMLGVQYDGGALGIAQSDELSGALTCNLGILRYEGNELWAQLDIRYPLCADEKDMCGAAAMALSPYAIALTRIGGHVPLHVPADHPVVKGLLEVYHELTGLEPYAMAIGGGTYSRMMPNTVAFGTLFPGDPDCIHMPDEFVDIEKYMLSIRIMAHAIVKLAGK